MTNELRVVRQVLPAAILLLLLIPLLAYRSFSAGPAEDPPRSAPASTPSSAAETALAPVIEQIINNSPFADARWGIHVVSLKNGQVLYSKNGDKLFTPASNMKLYTTAVTLDLLGADYRWRTSVFADQQPDANG